MRQVIAALNKIMIVTVVDSDAGIRDLGDMLSSGLKSSKYAVITLIVEYNYNHSSTITGYLLMSLRPTSKRPRQSRQRP